MARMAVIGGETGGRGLFGGNRSSMEWTGLVVFIVLAIPAPLSSGGKWYGLGLAALLVLAAYALFTPFALTGDRSVAALGVQRLFSRYLNLTGQNVFDPDADKNAKRTFWQILFRVRPGGNVPLFLGNTRWFEVQLSGAQPIVIFRHNAAGQKYFAVVMEVSAAADSLKEEKGHDAGHIGFGRFLASQAKENTLITRLQELSRAVPMDSSDHAAWVASKMPVHVPAVLRESYEQLIDRTRSSSEQHRSYYVAYIPDDLKFQEKASQAGHGHSGDGPVIVAELQKFAQQAKRAGLRGVRPLDKSRCAALFRALQNPSFDIDDTSDVSLETCWQKMDGTNRRHVVIGDRWVTKTAYVRVKDISPEAQPVQMLRPLLTGVHPSMVRTVSAVIDLVPARKARGKAKSDHAQDKATQNKRDQEDIVTDGGDEVLYNASRQRLIDLKPGSQHHGAAYGLYIVITVPSVDALPAAQGAIEGVAADCGIEQLTWLDDRHYLAMGMGLPLGRGIR